MSQPVTLRTLGIDFGFAENGESLGYSQFETRLSEGNARISVVATSSTATLAAFTQQVLPSDIAQQCSLLTLDAPITPVRIPDLPSAVQ